MKKVEIVTFIVVGLMTIILLGIMYWFFKVYDEVNAEPYYYDNIPVAEKLEPKETIDITVAKKEIIEKKNPYEPDGNPFYFDNGTEHGWARYNKILGCFDESNNGVFERTENVECIKQEDGCLFCFEILEGEENIDTNERE